LLKKGMAAKKECAKLKKCRTRNEINEKKIFYM
jgi:hypothetical protein